LNWRPDFVFIIANLVFCFSPPTSNRSRTSSVVVAFFLRRVPSHRFCRSPPGRRDRTKKTKRNESVTHTQKKERVRFQEFVTQRVRDPHTKKEKLKNNKEEQTQSSVR
jgi:hypothetical protein